jgi:hypothetical protein
VLPHFADWRAAYLGLEGNLHVVTLDGRADLTSGPAGIPLGGMTMNGFGLATAGISPDGSLLAYVGEDGMHVVAVRSGTTLGRANGPIANELFWSPNGNQIALGNGHYGFSVEGISDGYLRNMPSGGAVAPQGVAEIVGWTDPTHVAVQVIPTTPISGHWPTTESLGLVDITNWQVRVVASVSSPTLNEVSFALSPDGTEAVLYNRQFRADPYSPLADLIDVRTGAVTPLPRITAQVLSSGNGFTGIAWKPGTQTVLVSNGYGNGSLYLLDLGQDTALQQHADAQAGAMYPAGWSPDGSRVILSSGWQAGDNEGPFTLEAAAVGPQGITSTTVLTTNAANFPFLGFARNP